MKKSVFVLLILLSGRAFSQDVSLETCTKAGKDPVKNIIDFFVSDGHPRTKIEVTTEFYRLGISKLEYKYIQAVVLRSKSLVNTTYWVTVWDIDGNSYNYETKDKEVATQFLYSLRCLAGICK